MVGAASLRRPVVGRGWPGRGARATRRAAARGALAGLSLFAGALAGSFAGAAPAAATGASLPELRAQASALLDAIDRGALALHRLALDRQASEQALQAAQSALVRDEALVRRAAAARARALGALRTSAILAYLGAAASDALAPLLASSPSVATTRQGYALAASGSLSAAVAAYRLAERRAGALAATARSAAARAREALARLGAVAAGLAGEVAREQALLGEVHGEIATLVAKAAARAAAAAAARAAAYAAAQRLSAAEGLPSAAGVAAVAAGPLPTGSLAADFAALRECESGDDYQLDTGNGYYGAYQFSLSTWYSLGETGLPSAAPPRVQDAAAYRLYEQDGWSPWPTCAAMLGLS